MFLVFLVFFVVAPLFMLKFILNFNHLLVSLLILEFLSLSFFLGFSLNMQFYNLSSLYMLYFLVMVVCEGVLGLCLLVLVSFNYGNDFIFSMNSLTC